MRRMHGFHGRYWRFDLSTGRGEEMIRSYNLARGWTEEGYLPEAVLRDLAVDARMEP